MQTSPLDDDLLTWPEDDSYQPHIDRLWLGVLLARVEIPVPRVGVDCQRRFFVMRTA